MTEYLGRVSSHHQNDSCDVQDSANSLHVCLVLTLTVPFSHGHSSLCVLCVLGVSGRIMIPLSKVRKLGLSTNTSFEDHIV